jgi:hypothetical protein
VTLFIRNLFRGRLPYLLLIRRVATMTFRVITGPYSIQTHTWRCGLTPSPLSRVWSNSKCVAGGQQQEVGRVGRSVQDRQRRQGQENCWMFMRRDQSKSRRHIQYYCNSLTATDVYTTCLVHTLSSWNLPMLKGGKFLHTNFFLEFLNSDFDISFIYAPFNMSRFRLDWVWTKHVVYVKFACNHNA